MCLTLIMWFLISDFLWFLTSDAPPLQTANGSSSLVSLPSWGELYCIASMSLGILSLFYIPQPTPANYSYISLITTSFPLPSLQIRPTSSHTWAKETGFPSWEGLVSPVFYVTDEKTKAQSRGTCAWDHKIFEVRVCLNPFHCSTGNLTLHFPWQSLARILFRVFAQFTMTLSLTISPTRWIRGHLCLWTGRGVYWIRDSYQTHQTNQILFSQHL